MTRRRVIALETLKFLRENLKRKLFVVERRNQLECNQRPLTLKICQGQRSRSSAYFYSLCRLSEKKKKKKIYALLRIEKLYPPLHWTC